MKYPKLKVLWGYLVEPLLSGLIVFLGYEVVGGHAIAEFIGKVAVDLATLYCAVIFAAAFAFLWTFYSKADAGFYVWLDEIGAFNVYTNATIYVVVIEGLAIFSLLITKYYENETFALIALFVFLMAVINSYTMILNVVGLMKLQIQFNRMLHNSNSKKY
jgi:hypothetical protein